MIWNWQQEEWPKFSYKAEALAKYEAAFLKQSGMFLGALKCINEAEHNLLKVELISNEAYKTSAIEGEILDRDSIQFSLRKNFGLEKTSRSIPRMEKGITEMMLDLYRNFNDDLSEETLFRWSNMINFGSDDPKNCYRTHDDPMQIVSGPVHNPKVHFEAPDSKNVAKEMKAFIKWFNMTKPGSKQALPVLTRASIAHLYFVSVHPFEDGNGRIARALAVKALAQEMQQASLIALSMVIERKRKAYYQALDESNRKLEITDWLLYFGQEILEAQSYSQKMIEFVVNKAKFFDKYKSVLNSRQEKVIARVLVEGLEGFKGGLSAENYISISNTSSSTATRDLQELVSIGAMRQEGQLKSTRYHLNI